MSKVWVIMGNDYPGSVFDSEEAAMKEVEDLKANEETRPSKAFSKTLIYWRAYEFELNKPAHRRS